MGLESKNGSVGVKWQTCKVGYQNEESMKSMDPIDFLPEMIALFKQNMQILKNSETHFF